MREQNLVFDSLDYKALARRVYKGRDRVVIQRKDFVEYLRNLNIPALRERRPPASANVSNNTAKSQPIDENIKSQTSASRPRSDQQPRSKIFDETLLKSELLMSRGEVAQSVVAKSTPPVQTSNNSNYTSLTPSSARGLLSTVQPGQTRAEVVLQNFHPHFDPEGVRQLGRVVPPPPTSLQSVNTCLLYTSPSPRDQA
eukprot:TRINITY_DN23304_c0_g1_i1.p1 TRINITY_DN23304_c0_g1~~TRINITY_DN23304_c0_g1_i1.p1  ORF type:complete len:198 (-),score=19.47 TRINITY_DN23304_c0_g1_i1:91-684(-)